MNTPHTPGPWSISKHATPAHSPQFGIYADDGDGHDLAIVCNNNATSNARLISEAPELLSELRILLETAKIIDAGNKNQYGSDCHGFAPEVFAHAESIISKATGHN